MLYPEIEAFLDECAVTIDKTFDTLEADRKFLQPETKVSLAIDLAFALTIHRIGLTEDEFATFIRDNPKPTEREPV